MSKYIDEIVKDIRENPKSWRRMGDFGLKKDNIKLSQFGNGSRFFCLWMTSIVKIEINGKDCYNQTTFIDRYRLEEAFLWWMKNASIEMLSV